MAHHESLDNGDTDYFKVTPDHETLDKCDPDYKSRTLDNVGSITSRCSINEPALLPWRLAQRGTQNRHERTAEIELIHNRDSHHHKWMPNCKTLDILLLTRSWTDNGDFRSYNLTANHDAFDKRNSDYEIWLKLRVFFWKASSDLDFKSKDTKDSLASGMYFLHPFKELFLSFSFILVL